MKLLIIAIGLQIGLGALFFIGLFSQWTALMFVGFCLWTPCAWAVGYYTHRSGWQPLTFRPDDAIVIQSMPQPQRTAPRESRIRGA